jgi:hypothetical protein
MLEARGEGAELVSKVLRSYVMAVAKTSDLVWSELVRGHLREVSTIKKNTSPFVTCISRQHD